MRSIPFYKPSIGQAEIDEVVECLKSGWLTTGPRTKQFEVEFSKYVQHTHAIGLNSCTAALHLALDAIGLKAGQRVVVPTMTFAATAEVVRYFNASPLFVDCRPEDLNIDVNDAVERIELALASGEEVVAIAETKSFADVFEGIGVRPADTYRFFGESDGFLVLAMDFVFGEDPIDLVFHEMFG